MVAAAWVAAVAIAGVAAAALRVAGYTFAVVLPVVVPLAVRENRLSVAGNIARTWAGVAAFRADMLVVRVAAASSAAGASAVVRVDM